MPISDVEHVDHGAATPHNLISLFLEQFLQRQERGQVGILTTCLLSEAKVINFHLQKAELSLSPPHVSKSPVSSFFPSNFIGT